MGSSSLDSKRGARFSECGDKPLGFINFLHKMSKFLVFKKDCTCGISHTVSVDRLVSQSYTLF